MIDRAAIVQRMPIAFAVYTGCRQCEVIGLCWTDIACNRSAARIRRRYRKSELAAPKSATSIRAVEIPAELRNDFKAWKLACPKGDPQRDVALDRGLPQADGGLMHGSARTARGLEAALRRAGFARYAFTTCGTPSPRACSRWGRHGDSRAVHRPHEPAGHAQDLQPRRPEGTPRRG